MKRTILAYLAALAALMLPNAATAGQIHLIVDNFDAYGINSKFPVNTIEAPQTAIPTGSNWWSWGTLPATSADTCSVIADPTSTSGNVAGLHVAGESSTLWLYRYAPQNIVDGTFQAQADVYLKQTTTGFAVRCSYAFGVPPSGGNEPNNGRAWAVAVAFEGTTPLGAGAGPGDISYETQSFTQQWLATGSSYQANTWYTIQIVCHVSSKTFDVYFGPRGGTLLQIVGGLPFIKMASLGNTQVSQINCISFNTSVTGDPAGDMYVDNVSVQGDRAITVPAGITRDDPGNPYDSVAIRNLPIGTWVEGDAYQLRGYTAMTSTRHALSVTDPNYPSQNQLGRNFFYITDNENALHYDGIRLREYPLQWPVNVGDEVQFQGIIQRASDNGANVAHVGEKEIYVTYMATYPHDYYYAPSWPTPLGMGNSAIGGGGASWVAEPDGNPSQPGVFLAWQDATTWLKASGLNNIGDYGRFWGKVTEVSTNSNDQYYPWFYIDDGSGVNDGSTGFGSPPHQGVRVLMSKDRSGNGPPNNGVDLATTLSDLMGRYVLVTGVVGSIASTDLVPGATVSNVRVIRCTEEKWSDDFSSTGLWDPSRTYYDSNHDGTYDGIVVLD